MLSFTVLNFTALINTSLLSTVLFVVTVSVITRQDPDSNGPGWVGKYTGITFLSSTALAQSPLGLIHRKGS